MRISSSSSLDRMTADKKAAAMTEDKKAAALRYDEEKESAPRVIASGKGTVAEEIIRLARELDIPIHEDPDLVEILAALDPGEEIPEELYQVVAEILAFIYEMNEKA